jgi:hypothetical protein
VARDAAASVCQHLLNQAWATGRHFNEVLQHFALERFLYRLGRSPYQSLNHESYENHDGHEFHSVVLPCSHFRTPFDTKNVLAGIGCSEATPKLGAISKAGP